MASVRVTRLDAAGVVVAEICEQVRRIDDVHEPTVRFEGNVRQVAQEGACRGAVGKLPNVDEVGDEPSLGTRMVVPCSLLRSLPKRERKATSKFAQ